MANPRELAEQAFSLLQNALRDSESRASDLDEQLKRKRAPKNKLEEQLDVLTHRLEAVEAERTRWQQQASHLEEVAEAERTKVAQLRKKLDVAESGPEKLTKKEVNFWRAKAEEFTGETQDYRDRLAALRREIIERDALIEKLRDGQPMHGAPAAGSAEATAAPADTSSYAQAEMDNLRAEIEERGRRIGELETELSTARETHYGTPSPEHSLEIQARIETLSRQVATFDKALNEAHTARAAAKSDLAAARAELEPAQRSAREAQALAERTRAMLSEREQRIVELSAEVESARQRMAAERSAVAQAHGEIEQLRGTSAASQQRAEQLAPELERLRANAAGSQQRAEQLAAELDSARQALAQQSQFAREATAAGHAAQGLLSDLEAQLLALRGQVEADDRELDDRGQRITDLELALAAVRGEIEQRDREIGRFAHERADTERRVQDLERQLADHDRELDEHARAQTAVSAELEQARAMLEAGDRELTSMRDTLLGANRELEQLRDQTQRLDGALATALARADGTATQLARAEDEIRSLDERRLALERQRDEVGEQVAGLETELKEEKENAENLGAIANERRELMTKLQENVEEAEERYEEAKYRLTRTAHFERLVKRRKGLVTKLLNALRQKQKANTALKAGLDGLRTYKAGAEMNQQKLLQRIDALKVELKEAEETIARHHGTTNAKEQLASSETKVGSLEQRLNAQAEVIQTLENDLKAARAMAKSGDEKNHEIERLHKELETKTKVLSQLQTDADDQQRKLAKLRGSESETVRLKALTEKDRSEKDALEREVAQLRETLSRQSSGSGAGAPSAELESKLRDREQSVTRLMGTIKEHEATIKKLTDSSESWKRKYQFLASDSPDAYKTAAETK
jgi:chromosome segregation ATPase